MNIRSWLVGWVSETFQMINLETDQILYSQQFRFGHAFISFCPSPNSFCFGPLTSFTCSSPNGLYSVCRFLLPRSQTTFNISPPIFHLRLFSLYEPAIFICRSPKCFNYQSALHEPKLFCFGPAVSFICPSTKLLLLSAY